MKTGILTFHSAHNYGASLQAWALQKVLRDLGHDPVFINYRPESIDHLYDPLYYYSGMKRFFMGIRKRMKNKAPFIRRHRYETFLKEHFALTRPYHTFEELQAAQFDLDACIVGSDQVWNPAHTRGYDPAYFLEFLPETTRKISYAASVGRKNLSMARKADFTEGLKGFSSVSVREPSAQSLIQGLTLLPVQVTLDPTLLLDCQDYESLRKPVRHNERYILVYMMERNKKVIDLANHMSRVLGLPIVQRRPNQIFNNELQPCYTSTPDEFLDYIKEADYVITNSFHGTVFSIIYQKPFVSMRHSSTGSRVVDLLQSLGLEKHLLRPNEIRPSYEKFIYDEEEREQMVKLLKEYRQSSLDFLKTSLS